MDLQIELQDEQLLLLPERAVYWPARETLFVADTHWGKAATMRAHSLPIPMGTTEADLKRLGNAVTRMSARRLVLLGDAIHAKEGRAKVTLDTIYSWRQQHKELEILLVRGNHDHGAGDPPPTLKIHCTNSPHIEAPFAFQHHPVASEHGYVLAGHTHPALHLRGLGRQRATVPCFYFTPNVGTLPAFGSMCGRALITKQPEDRVYVIAEDEVLGV